MIRGAPWLRVADPLPWRTGVATTPPPPPPWRITRTQVAAMSRAFWGRIGAGVLERWCNRAAPRPNSPTLCPPPHPYWGLRGMRCACGAVPGAIAPSPAWHGMERHKDKNQKGQQGKSGTANGRSSQRKSPSPHRPTGGEGAKPNKNKTRYHTKALLPRSVSPPPFLAPANPPESRIQNAYVHTHIMRYIYIYLAAINPCS